jgi:hypothetical protein
MRLENASGLGKKRWNQLGNQLGNQLRSQLGDQLGNQLGSQLRNQLRYRVVAALCVKGRDGRA